MQMPPISQFQGQENYISYDQYALVTLLWFVAAVTDNIEIFDKHIQEPSILVWA